MINSVKSLLKINRFMMYDKCQLSDTLPMYVVEKWCQTNSDSIFSSLNYLHDNTWRSSTLARFHLGDCFRYHLKCNLNCRSFYWGFFTHMYSIPWKIWHLKILIIRLPGSVKVSFPSSFVINVSPTTSTLPCFDDFYLFYC